MLKLSKVERLPAKLEIMSFMSTFYEYLHAVRPRIDSICLASKSTRNSKKFKKILEIILAFGNYMNSSKKGAAYGFKMSSLDSLSITKSSDKKSTIVHYIVDVVNAKYPDLKGFESELRYIDKAAQFSLENIMTDVNELEKGMNLTLKELSARQNAPPNPSKTQRNLALKDFCDNANAQLKKLKADANNAKTVYVDCLEHFGEDAKNMDANTFFAILVRFCAGWKTAESENIKREKLKKAQELQKALQENNNQDNVNNQVNNKNARNMKNTQASLIAELKNKNMRKPINHIRPDEVKVSFTFYPHFGMSPVSEGKFQKKQNYGMSPRSEGKFQKKLNLGISSELEDKFKKKQNLRMSPRSEGKFKKKLNLGMSPILEDNFQKKQHFGMSPRCEGKFKKKLNLGISSISEDKFQIKENMENINPILTPVSSRMEPLSR